MTKVSLDDGELRLFLILYWTFSQ